MLDNKKLIVIICAVLLSCAYSIYYIYDNSTVSAETMIDRQIVIDAGHGGEDGGAVGLYEVVEKNINLSIALKLQGLFEASGFDVIMTRTEDVSIYEDGSDTLKQQKTTDLKARLNIANRNSNAIMVSIHQNSFTDSRYSGAQVFYGGENSYSKPLAESIQQAFIAYIQPDNTRQIQKITSSVYLVYNADIPAVLTECGFLSNPDDALNLADADYQKKVAFSIYSGVLNFYENNTLEVE